MSGLEIVAYALALLLALFFFRIFWRPLKAFLMMVFHAILGGLGLYICNFALAGLGLSLGINIVTASVCGLFGIPGLILLLILKVLFKA